MLRDWNADNQSQDERHDFTSREQNDPPAANANIGVLREWSGAPATEVNVQEEQVEHYLGRDPLSGSVVSGLSMPVFADVGIEQNPFDDDASRNMTTYGMVIDTENEQDLQMIPSQPDGISNAFASVDVEACQGLPTSDYGGLQVSNRSNINMRSDRFSFIWQKLNEIRTNPAAKFKFMVSISVFIVIVCIIAIAGASSSNKQTDGPAPTKGSGIVTTLPGVTSSPHGKQSNTDSPTPSPIFGTLQMASSLFTNLPTFSPTAIPTYEIQLPPTDLPTSTESTSPSNTPTLSPITSNPTSSPITLAPTMDCSDSKGSYLTFNNKLRDCAWLDNGYNGAKSERKDMNCLSSDLGDKCRYTCRLYNGCMNDLLSRIDAFSNDNDFSIGDSCTDKVGTFMGNNHIPRNCSWIEEDPYTAPMKKNLNCGTPDEPRTELGAMCPASCAGYNPKCGKDESRVVNGDDDDTNSVTAVLSDDGGDMDNDNDDDDGGDDDGDDDGNSMDDGLFPTLAPTFANETTSDTGANLRNATCIDADGDFETHVGPAHFRQVSCSMLYLIHHKMHLFVTEIYSLTILCSVSLV
jgi:hypothetical protein